MSTPEQPSFPPPRSEGYYPPVPMSTANGPVDVAVPDPAGPPSPPYPVQLEIGYPAELNRWLPLVKWLLLIPHYVVLWFLGIAAFFAAVFAWFAVLFTGRYPRGLFDFVVGVHRWAYRVNGYYFLMLDPYPPFSLQDDPGYPLRMDIAYPERVANWRPLVQWLLAWPYLIVAGVLAWLSLVLVVVAFFTILFTKRIPRGVFELMMPGLRWSLRGNAYAYFLTDQYPPWIRG